MAKHTSGLQYILALVIVIAITPAGIADDAQDQRHSDLTSFVEAEGGALLRGFEFIKSYGGRDCSGYIGAADIHGNEIGIVVKFDEIGPVVLKPNSERQILVSIEGQCPLVHYGADELDPQPCGDFYFDISKKNRAVKLAGLLQNVIKSCTK